MGGSVRDLGGIGDIVSLVRRSVLLSITSRSRKVILTIVFFHIFLRHRSKVGYGGVLRSYLVRGGVYDAIVKFVEKLHLYG